MTYSTPCVFSFVFFFAYVNELSTTEDLCPQGWLIYHQASDDPYYIETKENLKRNFVFCYWFQFESPSTFESAVDYCESRNSYLASIHSEKELIHVQRYVNGVMMRAVGHPVSYVWVGLERSAPTTEWQWVDGTQFDDTSPPAHTHNLEAGPCAALTSTSQPWLSMSCQYRLPFICKRDEPALDLCRRDICRMEGLACVDVPGTFQCVCGGGSVVGEMMTVGQVVGKGTSSREQTWALHKVVSKCKAWPGECSLSVSKRSRMRMTCGMSTLCASGFRSVAGVGCVDVNECVEDVCEEVSCGGLGRWAVCINTEGSYRCECVAPGRPLPGDWVYITTTGLMVTLVTWSLIVVTCLCLKWRHQVARGRSAESKEFQYIFSNQEVEEGKE